MSKLLLRPTIGMVASGCQNSKPDSDAAILSQCSPSSTFSKLSLFRMITSGDAVARVNPEKLAYDRSCATERTTNPQNQSNTQLNKHDEYLHVRKNSKHQCITKEVDMTIIENNLLHRFGINRTSKPVEQALGCKHRC